MMRSIALGTAVFLLAFGRSLADGIGLADESWFLQVVARMRSGDVLYQDVFLGVTPLSAYVTSLVTFITGVEIVAVKIVTNACFAVSTVLAGRLATRAGLSSRSALAVMAAMFVWARPYNNPPYTPMAMTFFLATIVVSLSACARSSRAGARLWLGAGALAGLAFASKQNVGLLALGAAGIVLSAGERAGWRATATTIGWMLVGCAAAAFVVLLPVALSGGLPGLWDYGFVGKGAYLDIGSVSYLGSLTETFTYGSDTSASAVLAGAVHGVPLLLPLAVLAAAAALAPRLDRLDWTMVACALTAALVAFPRWDRFHMAYAVPLHLVAIGRLVPRIGFMGTRPAFGRAFLWAISALAIVVAAQPVRVAVRGGLEPLGMPHFGAAFMPGALAGELRADAAAIRDAARGQPVFIVRRDAGFWYLASGVSNPTPFDIPARTATGSSGIAGVLRRLEAGEIPLVCLEDGPPHPQSLVEIETFVRERYHRDVGAGPCTMFTIPGSRVAKQRS